MDKPLLRVGKAAHLLNVSRWTIYRWIEEGQLEATKIGKGSLRVFQESVTALEVRNRVNDAMGTTRLRVVPTRFNAKV